MIKWGQKSKPPKTPGPKFNAQKSHAKFLSHKNFQKALNDITTNHQTVLNTPKNPYLNQVPPPKSSPKSFDPPCHLKSEVPPWGKEEGKYVPPSEFQNLSFCILRRTPCPCWYIITVFLLALIKVSIHLVWFVTISFALCRHFKAILLVQILPQQLTGPLYNSLTSLALNWVDTFPPGRGTPSFANLAWAASAFFCRWKSELSIIVTVKTDQA